MTIADVIGFSCEILNSFS